MSDDEFLGYCEIHCRAERPLFNGEQIRRLHKLAGAEWGDRRHGADYWLIAQVGVVQPLVDKARRRLRETTQRTQDENVLARGFVEGDLE